MAIAPAGCSNPAAELFGAPGECCYALSDGTVYPIGAGAEFMAYDESWQVTDIVIDAFGNVDTSAPVWIEFANGTDIGDSFDNISYPAYLAVDGDVFTVNVGTEGQGLGSFQMTGFNPMMPPTGMGPMGPYWAVTFSSEECGSNDAAPLSTSIDLDCSHTGDQSVTLVVTDVNGNSSSAPATITVVDNIDPTAAAQNITVQLDATGNASITAAQVDNGSNDPCSGIASMTVSPDSFDCEDLGDNMVTLTVFDGSGNSATAAATVTVVDEIAPDVTAYFPVDIVIYADDVTGYFDPTP